VCVCLILYIPLSLTWDSEPPIRRSQNCHNGIEAPLSITTLACCHLMRFAMTIKWYYNISHVCWMACIATITRSRPELDEKSSHPDCEGNRLAGVWFGSGSGVLGLNLNLHLGFGSSSWRTQTLTKCSGLKCSVHVRTMFNVKKCQIQPILITKVNFLQQKFDIKKDSLLNCST